MSALPWQMMPLPVARQIEKVEEPWSEVAGEVAKAFTGAEVRARAVDMFSGGAQ
jgi:hypothetical protein